MWRFSFQLISVVVVSLSGCTGSPVDIYNSKNLASFSSEDLCNAYEFSGGKQSRLIYEVAMRKDISVKEMQLIKKGVIAVGMSRMSIYCSLGAPSSINTTQTAYGKEEQFVYNDLDGMPSSFVYVSDGIVTAWQY